MAALALAFGGDRHRSQGTVKHFCNQKGAKNIRNCTYGFLNHFIHFLDQVLIIFDNCNCREGAAEILKNHQD